MASDVVSSLAFREKVSAALAAVAAQQLSAGRPLEAGIAANACLHIDRYHCPCIRDSGLAAGRLKSADSKTRLAAQGYAWGYLVEYVSCDETAADAAQMFALAAKWANGARWPAFLAPLPADALKNRAPAALLADGNARFAGLVPLEAKRRFEVCALSEPVTCACARRAGDTWLKLGDRERAVVWWSRYLDCAPNAADRAQVHKDIAAATTALSDAPIWQGVLTAPSNSNGAAPHLAKGLIAQAREALKDKRLDDAITAWVLCRLMDPSAFECALGLGDTLRQLDRRLEASQVFELLLKQLPERDQRRGEVKKRLGQ